MNLAWTKHLDHGADVQAHLQGIKHSYQLDYLQMLLTEMKESEERKEQSSDTYDKPNWDYRQADRNGYIRCLNSIINLLDQRKQ